jgi:hypothetical protein
MEPVCRYPLVLWLTVFLGVGRTIRDLRVGRETTTIAVHISAVHQASRLDLEHCARRMSVSTWNEHDGRLTARRIVDSVVCYGVGDETGETNDHGDHAEGEDTDEADLLTPAELQTVDDREGKAED